MRLPAVSGAFAKLSPTAELLLPDPEGADGDVPIIAQTVLGVEWRSASSSQRRAFTDAFKGYMARKYGKRFEEFVLNSNLK